MFPLLPTCAGPVVLLFALWQPNTPANWQLPVAQTANTLAYYRAGELNPAPDDIDLDTLLSLQWDIKADWNSVDGIVPPKGSLGMHFPQLEVAYQCGSVFRWVFVGSTALHDGHYWAMVFTSANRGTDGQPHFTDTQWSGVFRLSDEGAAALLRGNPYGAPEASENLVAMGTTQSSS
jgi:hypothetical protein